VSSELDRAREAFVRGDFANVRRAARAALAAGELSDKEKAEADELLARAASDRAMTVLLGACVAFFFVIVVLYVGRG
jgi:hypothetical protein